MVAKGGKGKSGGKGYGKVGAKRHAKKQIRETIFGSPGFDNHLGSERISKHVKLNTRIAVTASYGTSHEANTSQMLADFFFIRGKK